MTEPRYDANLRPGFIVDLELGDTSFWGKSNKAPWQDFDFSSEFPTYMVEANNGVDLWCAIHLSGVYMISHPSTAHWAYHLKLSHPDDVAFVQGITSTKVTTENIDGFVKKSPQRIMTMDEVYSSAWCMYNNDGPRFGKNIDLPWFKEWLAENPYPVPSALTAIYDKGRERANHNHVMSRLEQQLQIYFHGLDVSLEEIQKVSLTKR